MPATAVLGMQFGDEGKGKIVDLLARDFDYVVRFNGSDNAGHAVKVGGRRVGLQLFPSSIFHPRTTKVIAAGTVINPDSLLDEVTALEEAGFSLDRLAISDRAHLILPWHKLADLDRTHRTMRKGIGPAYADKAARLLAIRVSDLLQPGFEQTLHRIAHEKGRFDVAAILAILRKFARRFRSHITDTARLLNHALDRGKQVLLEGAQGALLDLDYGTFPYVTSSSTTAGGACTGAGLAPHRIDRVIGVVKAYMTRAGPGPFPTEANAEDTEILRQRGLEFGTSAGLLRRCGWLDLVALKYAVMLNRPTELALMKLDVVEGLPYVPVCVRYRIGRCTTDQFALNLKRATPIYEEIKPAQLATFIAKRVGVPICILSFGAERNATMLI